MRRLATVVLVTACATTPQRSTPDESAPLVPEAVRVKVTVSDARIAELGAEAEGRVRRRLQALGHALDDASAVSIELDATPKASSTFADGVHRYCASVSGAVVHGGTRFSALDTVSERCDVERNSPGGTDPLSGAIGAAVSVLRAMKDEEDRPDLRTRLYLEALDRLTETLSRQASRRARSRSPAGRRRDDAQGERAGTSKRSRFVTFAHAFTKSCTNCCWPSADA